MSERTPPVPPPSEALLAAVARARPVSPRAPRRQLAIVVAAGALSVALALVLVGPRRDLGALPASWVAIAGGLWLAACGGLFALAVLPPRGEVMPRAKLASMAGVSAFLAMAVVALLWTARAPESEPAAAGFLAFAGQALRCLGGGLVVALFPLGLALVLLRYAAPDRPAALAAGLGAGAGALGGFALHLVCAIGDGRHVATGHAGVIAGAAALAAIIAALAARKSG